MRRILAASAVAGLLLTGLAGPAAADPISVGEEAVIMEGIYLRTDPGASSEVLDLLPLGSIVFVQSGPRTSDGIEWFEVEQDGVIGWASGEYIQPRTAEAALKLRPLDEDRTTGTLSSRGTNRPAAAKLALERESMAVEAVRLRKDPGTSADSLDILPEGSLVYVMAGPEWVDGIGWYQVEQDGTIGWASGDYIEPLDSERALKLRLGGGSTAQPAAKLPTGREAVVADTIRLRAAPGGDGRTVNVLPLGSIVFVIEGPRHEGGQPWYKVEQDGQIGWASGEFIEPRTASTATAVRSSGSSGSGASGGATRTASTAGGGSSSGGGGSRGTTSVAAPGPASGGIVATGLRYVGVPYRYGGTTPSGFDCSGFTSFVLAQYGIYPGRTTYVQWGAGRPVAVNQLQPGDLVFFANTFGPGISHVGIYIGGGQMVHAGSERTGVTISSIFDAYWGAHYAGARRYT